jgi:AcrR family transcriptional regulator
MPTTKVGLDREQVVAAVLRLARDEGIEQVSMRALAAELGVSAPSLYHHLPSKEAILDLAAEEVLASIRVPAAAGSWDLQLSALYANGRQAMLPVPGIATVLQTRPLVGAGKALDRVSRRILEDAGLSAARAREANAVLYTYVLGSVALAHSYAPASSDKGFDYGLRAIIAGIREQEQLP